MRHIAIVMILMLTLWVQVAFGQPADAPPRAVQLSVDLTSLSGDVSFDDVEIWLNETIVANGELNADGTITIPVKEGKNKLKVLVRGEGADGLEFELKPEATGYFVVKLSPHPLGLTKHIDDYKLVWANLVDADFVPSALPMDLKFVDNAGVLMPVTQIMEARLSTRHFVKGSVNVTSLFSVSEAGIITLQDKQRFLQDMTDLDLPKGAVELKLRARNSNSGLDYEAGTRINLAPVSISGRVILGETVPDTISLEGIEVRMSGAKRKTDRNGRFSVAGVPAGETIIRTNIYVRKPVEGSKTGRTSKVVYEAKGTFELSGKSEVEITLELRKRGGKRGKVELLSHEATPPFTPQPKTSLQTSDIFIPPAARFKLINLISNPDNISDWERRQKAGVYCKEAYKRGWHVRQYCQYSIDRTWPKPASVRSGPEDGDKYLGDLRSYDGGVWFTSKGDWLTSRIIPQYHLSDWGYGGFGYAVTVLDFKNGKVAIHLPDRQEAGWIDLADLLEKNAAEASDFDAAAEWEKTYFTGFNPLDTCGTRLGDQEVVVESLDVDSFTYREPTPHDLWSPYNDSGERPPLGEHESITAPWQDAYTADRVLRLIPNEGKEC